MKEHKEKSSCSRLPVIGSNNKNYCILIGSLLLFLLSSSFGQSDYDYSYDEDDYYGGDYDPGTYDDCSFYHDDHDANGECHHQAFPTTTLDQVFSPNVKQCCSVHSYMFYDNCEDRSTQNADVCSEPRAGAEPTLPEVTVECPLYCKLFKELKAEEFQVAENGEMTIKGMENVTNVHDYCVTYSCLE